MSSPSGSSSSRELVDWPGYPSSRQNRAHFPPNAPYLSPVALPDLTMTPPSTPRLPVSSIPGGSARSRPISLPAQQSGPDRFVYGLPTPTNPRFPSMNIHPLLRIEDQFASCAISYNVLYAPALSGPRPLIAPSIPALTEHDLGQVAFTPAFASLRLAVHLFSHPQAGPAQFPWSIAASPSRRVSAPIPGQASALTVFDVLASLHLALMAPVGDHELSRFPSQQLDSAQAMRARRLQLFGSNNTPMSFVRSDFLGNCTNFAGILKNPDGSMIIKLSSRTLLDNPLNSEDSRSVKTPDSPHPWTHSR